MEVGLHSLKKKCKIKCSIVEAIYLELGQLWWVQFEQCGSKGYNMWPMMHKVTNQRVGILQMWPNIYDQEWFLDDVWEGFIL